MEPSAVHFTYYTLKSIKATVSRCFHTWIGHTSKITRLLPCFPRRYIQFVNGNNDLFVCFIFSGYISLYLLCSIDVIIISWYLPMFLLSFCHFYQVERWGWKDIDEYCWFFPITRSTLLNRNKKNNKQTFFLDAVRVCNLCYISVVRVA